MHSNNIYMPLRSNTIITTISLHQNSHNSPLLSSPHLFNMPINYLPQSTQGWSWEQAMDPHLHHFQVEQEEESEREHMFEKPLTPSDVGKLNRLVIPKQHAEKHFPLAGASGEKGLLLSFEDEESGKQWRFRYSYWTSSQSYVLTKGWSRYVKEKRLDAGDVVLFRRRRRDHLLYIGSRRRGGELLPPDAAAGPSAVLPWSPAFYTAAAAASPSASCLYVSSVQQDCHLHAARQTGSMGESSTESTPGNPKRLRLFGVNLEYCGPEL